MGLSFGFGEVFIQNGEKIWQVLCLVRNVNLSVIAAVHHDRVDAVVAEWRQLGDVGQWDSVSKTPEAPSPNLLI